MTLTREGSQNVRAVFHGSFAKSVLVGVKYAPNRTSTLMEEYAMALVESREGFDAPLLQ